MRRTASLGRRHRRGSGVVVYPVARGSFPFRIFANAQGEVVGAQIVGYMLSEIFVAPEIDPMALGTLLRANRDEISHQDE